MNQKTELQNLEHNEITKKIRQQLKEEFKGFKFSTRQQQHSGGWSIQISIMESPIRIIRRFEDISEKALSFFDKEDRNAILRRQKESNYHQLSNTIQPFDADIWNNGVFLTEKGHNVVKRIVEITQPYNWDNSDSSSDYFDVNFYLYISLGKWNIPFIDGTEN